MIVLAARHDMGARRLDETNRLIVYALDNAAAMADDAARNPLGKFLCLFDLSGAPPLLLVLRRLHTSRGMHDSPSAWQFANVCVHGVAGLRMNNLDVKALRGIFELLQVCRLTRI